MRIRLGFRIRIGIKIGVRHHLVVLEEYATPGLPIMCRRCYSSRNIVLWIQLNNHTILYGYKDIVVRKILYGKKECNNACKEQKAHGNK